MAFIFSAGKLSAQEILPGITVKNFNGKIIISWRNQYPLEVKTINIQRSYDSMKNYSTIGSVLNPQNAENGFVDEAPPYNKMYYRVFISFEGGDYIFSDAARPVKEVPPPQPIFVQETVVDPFKKADMARTSLKESKKDPADPGSLSPRDKKKGQGEKEKKGLTSKKQKKEKEPVLKDDKNNDQGLVTADPADAPANNDGISGYPSKRIYISRYNNVVINLGNADYRKYTVKFFEEGNKFLFELNRIKENFLIIEKVNFLHAGWFYFELFENGKMVEKNKFFIPRDNK